MDKKQWKIESGVDVRKPLVKNASKGEHICTVILQHITNRDITMWTKRFTNS